MTVDEILFNILWREVDLDMSFCYLSCMSAVEQEKVDRIRETLEGIDEIFFSRGVDRIGRAIILEELIEGMERNGELTKRHKIEMQGLIVDYFTA